MKIKRVTYSLDMCLSVMKTFCEKHVYFSREELVKSKTDVNNTILKKIKINRVYSRSGLP